MSFYQTFMTCKHTNQFPPQYHRHDNDAKWIRIQWPATGGKVISAHAFCADISPRQALVELENKDFKERQMFWSKWALKHRCLDKTPHLAGLSFLHCVSLFKIGSFPFNRQYHSSAYPFQVINLTFCGSDVWSRKFFLYWWYICTILFLPGVADFVNY